MLVASPYFLTMTITFPFPCDNQNIRRKAHLLITWFHAYKIVLDINKAEILFTSLIIFFYFLCCVFCPFCISVRCCLRPWIIYSLFPLQFYSVVYLNKDQPTNLLFGIQYLSADWKYIYHLAKLSKHSISTNKSYLWCCLFIYL